MLEYAQKKVSKIMWQPLTSRKSGKSSFIAGYIANLVKSVFYKGGGENKY